MAALTKTWILCMLQRIQVISREGGREGMREAEGVGRERERGRDRERGRKRGREDKRKQ